MSSNQNKPIVLIVDDTQRNIDVLKSILAEDYSIRVATKGRIALKIVEKQKPDLILLDVMMPEMDGYEVCKKLKSSHKTASIPVIFVTAMTDTSDEEKGFNLGAVDYITKPVVPAVVKARVKTHIELSDQRRACEREIKLRTKELEESQLAAINMLGTAGHYNDTDTGVHIWRMAAYSSALAKAAGWSAKDADLLELAAPMHDMGKVGIPDQILKAPRKLTDDEMDVMKTHTYIGYGILSQSETPLFQLAAEVALYHHEKWNGEGYPDGLKQADIPESARIVAIADVFDALTMKRPYKEAWPIEKAVETIKKDAGSHFDPNLVELFIANIAKILEIKELWDEKEKAL